jgi:3-dehydrosphinganine reductase
MMAVNYFGVVHCAQSVLPGMVSRGHGRFAAVCSMVASCPFVGYAAYAPAKAACRSLVDTLRNEFADTPVQFHIAFPPDTDTPGLARENETKPFETSHIWPECFNETFAASDVARCMLDDLQAGRYFLRSPDAFGNLIVDRGWGHYPRAAPLFLAAIAPLFVGLHQLMCWMADRAVKKGNRHSGGANNGWSMDASTAYVPPAVNGAGGRLP